MTDIIALTGGLLLPWVLGIAALLAMQGARVASRGAGEMAWMAGVGYLAGAFLLTVWMRVLSLAGIRFSGISIAIPLIVLTVALGFVAWRRGALPGSAHWRDAARNAAGPAKLTGATRALWWLLIAWLVVRFALLGVEIASRPLYPWDAWLQWATKARVWYALGQMAPFARAAEWMAANGTVYFDASPEYPPTMPLLQVWSCICMGRWDDVLMNWPWWQMAVALTLAMYGGLRSLGASALAALIGAFLVASLPLGNVHVALAGYADLPLAAYYTTAVLAFLRWTRRRDWPDALLVAWLLVAATQVKNPGIAWAATLVPALAIALLPRYGRRVAAILFAVAIVGLLVLARVDITLFNYRLHLAFDPAWSALGASFFLLGNWNLLWYGAIAVALLAWPALLRPSMAPITVIVAAGMLFLFVVFGFTNARAWVADQTSINRATLHLAPVIVVFMVLAWQAFAHAWRERFASPASREVTPHPQQEAPTPA